MTRSRIRIRFRPPRVAPTAEMRWILASAFGPVSSPVPPDGTDLAGATDLAARLALLPRLAARLQSGTMASESGVALAERLRRERMRCLAHELRLDTSLGEVAGIATGLGIGIAPLKGRALTLGGYAAPGARPSADIDLLAPAAALMELRRALRREGFVETGGTGYEHHAPVLQRPGGVNLELHGHVPGVRLDGRRSADWEVLEGAGLLNAMPSGSTLPSLRLPATAVLVAHALVHALAQHGLSASYPGWLLVGDLVDLRATTAADNRWRSWISRDLSPDEIDAALELTAIVSSGGNPLQEGSPSQARRLAEHFVACALDADYGQALKARWLEAPISERSRLGARFRLLARTLAPPPVDAAPGIATGRLSRSAAWLRRPFELLRKTVRTLLAQRRVADGRGDLREHDDGS